MSDLISRSALLDMLLTENQRCITSTSHELTINMVVSFIKAQPTVYDIEKVVEELEKEKEIHTEHYNISLYKDYPEIKQRYEQIQGVIDKAIDIVRKGGVE